MIPTLPLKRLHKKIVLLLVAFGFFTQHIKAQDFNVNSAIYNVMVGGLSGGLGAMINKHKDQKLWPAFLKGFVTGMGGGAVVYSGKKLNFLVSQKQNLGYAWLSRAVFSAGNSVVENAAASRPFWSQWHYDLAFVRLEFHAAPFVFIPRLMPSNFLATTFMAINGRLDVKTSLKSGTITFRTPEIHYSPTLIGSTTGNGFLLVDTLRNSSQFFDVYAHELIHTFQFQEFSGINYFFNPITDQWKERHPRFKKWSKWIYGDVNYELMLFNYFVANRGSKQPFYCRNFLENEAEFLSVGRCACN